VRVEYMEKESQRFADLLADGRDPKSIDLASEVLDYSRRNPVALARGDVRAADAEMTVASNDAESRSSFWSNFVSDANAGEVSSSTVDAAPVGSVATTDLPATAAVPRVPSEDRIAAAAPAPIPPAMAAPQPLPAPVAAIAEPPEAVDTWEEAEAEEDPTMTSPPIAASLPVDAAPSPDMAQAEASPFAVLETAAGEPEMQLASTQPAPPRPSPAMTAAHPDKVYVQLGAFQNRANAESVRSKYARLTGLKIVEKPNASGTTLYHVRMGPYDSSEASQIALNKVRELGGDAKFVRE
jgi:cell division septation protein DedD